LIEEDNTNIIKNVFVVIVIKRQWCIDGQLEKIVPKNEGRRYFIFFIQRRNTTLQEEVHGYVPQRDKNCFWQ
jgi:hypothetical protein